MFLFESFTYDDRWASLYYDNFYDSSEWFSNYLNKDYNNDYGKFMTRHCYDKNHNNNLYEISFIDTHKLFSDGYVDVFPLKAHKYAIEKLKNYGDCIEILNGIDTDEDWGNDQKNIRISYRIEKDKKRWNDEHKRYEDAFKSDEILDCIPTLEQWLYMINAKFEKKQPTRFLAKESNLKSAAAKYIVATKLEWDEAIEVLTTNIIQKMLSTGIYMRQSDQFPSFIKILEAYAKEKYEIDPDIQELLNDLQSVDKHVKDGSHKIPAKYYEIAKKLDTNVLVEKYQFIDLYDNAINIQTTNGNVGRIYIDIDEKLENNFFFITLHLKNTHFLNDIKSNSYKFKDLPSIIDSAVNAIYYNDYKKLNEMIKI